MRAQLALVRYSLRRARGLLVGLAVLVFVFQALAVRMAATFDESQTLARLIDLVPPYLRELLGSSMISMLSFTGIVALGYFHVALVGALVGSVVAVATEPAAEVERGFADLLMARPIRRAHLVTRSAIVVLLTATWLNAAMLAGTWVGLVLFAASRDAWPSMRLLVSLAANLWALMMCWGGLAMAVACRARRRGVAGAAAGFAVLTLYLLDLIGRVWPTARPLRWVSPFRFFNPIELVSGRPLVAWHLVVLVAVGVAGILVAYGVYSRRDL